MSAINSQKLCSLYSQLAKAAKNELQKNDLKSKLLEEIRLKFRPADNMDSLLLTTKQLEHIGLAVLSFIGYKQTNKIYLNIYIFKYFGRT